MEINVTSVNNTEIDEINNARVEEMEREAAQREQERADKIAAMQKMTTAEYIAYRHGKPAPMSNADLGNLSMPEYIKARREQHK